MRKHVALLAAVALAIIMAVPAVAGAINTKQKASSEQFIKGLMKGDYKEAYQQFSPAVRGRYPFPIFTDIQNNIKKTIGMPVSYTLRSGKDQAEGPGSCIYDLVYAQEAKKTAIPLQLTFTPEDPDGKIETINFLKAQMKELSK